MNFQTMNRQRKLVLFASVAGIISVFLPWFSAGAFGYSVHINGFHGWGILAFLAFLVSVLIVLLGMQTEALDKTMWLAVITCGALALLSVIITLISSQGGGDFGIVSAGLGFGIWIALIAAAGVTLFAWLFRNPAHDLKSSFDSLKKTVSSSSSNLNSSSSTLNSSPGDNKIAELERLIKLRDNGSITEAEYQQLKSKIL